MHFKYRMEKSDGGPYVLEVALLPRSLSNMFAGGHALLHLRRGLCQADTELLGGSPIQSVICAQMLMHLQLYSHLTDASLRKHSRSFSSTDFISPFLSLSLENMSSDRAVFIAYSSALVMSVMELQRLQGTRKMPFPSVVRGSLFIISEVLSLLGVQGRICIFSKRGRIFKRT